MDSSELPTSFDAAFRWLATRTNYETMSTQRYDSRTYGLARVERLLAELGRPDRAVPSIQVVGSKGKGSTTACLAAMLRADGRRTGSYTSPHLVHARERIRVDGRPVPDELFVAAIQRIVPSAEAAARSGAALTFFELQTAAALVCFAEAGCDVAVLEAGMGGRLDATTAADRSMVLLTNVSVDHGRQLGRTRAAIAVEKVAAARAGVPVLTGERGSTRAGRVIREHCDGVRAPLVQRGRDFRVARVEHAADARRGTVSTSFRLHRRGQTSIAAAVPLLGTHQAANAALALTAVLHPELPGGPVAVDTALVGLGSVRLAARGQVLATRPWWIVDGAHSPRSMGVLARQLDARLPHRRAVYVVGIAADKQVRGMLLALRGRADLVVATTSHQPRAMPPEELAALAREVGLDAIARPDLASALEQAEAAVGPDDLVVVTGSLYLCGQVPGLLDDDYLPSRTTVRSE